MPDRVQNGEKRIINAGSTDPNKLMPLKYTWAWDYYMAGTNNNWVPNEIPMQNDVEQWNKKGFLSDAERRVIIRNLGFFSTAESLTANNIVLAIYRHLTCPELRQYLLRQALEEAVHSHMFVYCCESLGINQDEIYDSYINDATTKEKDEFVVDITKTVFDSNFKTDSVENIQKFVHDLVGYYVIMEGIFFYAGFVMMLSFKRTNKMVGLGEQFDYVLRDETVHLAFGSDVINAIIQENPEIWTEEFKKSLSENIQKGVELECNYAQDCLQGGILGLRADSVCQYVRYIADRRLERIGLAKMYGDSNPFPWMSEVVDLAQKKNFFESRPTEYQNAGALNMDDF